MRLTCGIMLILAALTVSAATLDGQQKKIVGAIEIIQIEKGGLNFRARVDTGAKTSSIHAVDIKVDSTIDPSGKPISFRIVNKDGLSRKIETVVSSVVEIRTSEGSDRRYKVPLTLKWKDSRKTVLVTLNDRRSMTYRLLLGRNWLRGDFLVDIDINNQD